jgi:Acyclic terpene utilisation family protein AtuA
MIRVGNAQAFWGDRPAAAIELLAQAPELDFLTMDYLAEVSMSILAQQRERNTDLGYAQDFVNVVSQLSSYWAAGGRCRLIANAGGLNPVGCAQACLAALKNAGCRPLKIGVVSGDDVLAYLQSDRGPKKLFENLDSQQPYSEMQSRLVTANAYLGCSGIVGALQAGADIVITGRVADPSMVVACCVYAFEWTQDDWDRLAGATVAGHLLECGTHVTGGIATDWLDVPDPAHMGFPIAEINVDGSCTITKTECSGGQVTEATVKEQLLYEISDPDNYLSPDVAVSFLRLEVQQQGENRVTVRGAKGRPRPTTLKVSATYRDGYRAAGMLTIFGPRAVLKAQRCGEIVLQRLRDAGHEFRDSIIECLGNAASVPATGITSHSNDLLECVLRVAVESDSKFAVEQFTREMIPLVTAGPQGTTGYAEGRPRLHEVYRYWPCLIETDRVESHIAYFESPDSLKNRKQPANWPPPELLYAQIAAPNLLPDHRKELQLASCLADIAYGRSGDKGTAANIGILVRSPENYDWLRTWLTSDRVADYFEPIGIRSVERFEVPNLGGLNFMVRGILRRGLRNDAQGKSLAQALLLMPLKGTDTKHFEVPVETQGNTRQA